MNTPSSDRIILRSSATRGQSDHGWLQSQHTFSFGDYYNPAQKNFRSLRVINEDRVAGGHGFGTHPHRDMEIFSYVLSGALEHKDSLGNGRVLAPGQIQLLSAGRGVSHSEFNPSATEPTHFLQIWIEPKSRGKEPSYTEWHPSVSVEQNPKVLVISPDGHDGSAQIHQEASVYLLKIPAGGSVSHQLSSGRGLWLQVMRGSLMIDNHVLMAGDGVCSEQAGEFTFQSHDAAEALLFDLA